MELFCLLHKTKCFPISFWFRHSKITRNIFCGTFSFHLRDNGYRLSLKISNTSADGGIIAKVSTCLSLHGINIIDITQTILSGNFVMMMMVDLSKSNLSIQDTKKELSSLGDELGVSINMMHERVFSAMHRI